MKCVAVYCGSSRGNNPAFIQMAEMLGFELAKQNIAMVYGGGRAGLMGVVADAVMRAGGHVTGIIPHHLNTKEIQHDGISEVITVETMHERKTKMAAMADGAIALPGGFGTLEEIFEFITWTILDIHSKPAGFLNVAGHYNNLLTHLERANSDGLIHQDHVSLAIHDNNPERLIRKMCEWKREHKNIAEYKATQIMEK